MGEPKFVIVFILFSGLAISLWTAPIRAETPPPPSFLSCTDLVAQISEGASSPSEVYLRLFTAFVKNRNALSAQDIKVLLNQGVPVNPFKVLSPALTSELSFAYNTGFEKVISGGGVEWAAIKGPMEKIFKESTRSDRVRAESSEETKMVILPKVLKNNFPDEAQIPTLGALSYPASSTIFYADETPWMAYPARFWGKSLKGEINLFNLKEKKYMTLKTPGLSGDGIVSVFQFEKETYFTFVDSDGDLQAYDLKGKRQSKNLLPKERRTQFKERNQVRSDIVAIQRDGETVLINWDNQDKRGLLIFTPVGNPKKKQQVIQLKNDTGSDYSESFMSRKSPTCFNFKDGAVAAVVDNEGIVYFFDPMTGTLRRQVQLKNARDSVIFYEVGDHEPRALVPIWLDQQAIIFNPLTGKKLGTLDLEIGTDPSRLVFWKDEQKDYLAVQLGPTKDGDDAIIVDLGENKILNEKIPLFSGDYNASYSHNEGRVTSNVAKVEVNGRQFFIWGDHSGHLIYFDLQKRIEGFHLKIMDNPISQIVPYRNGNRWEAAVFPAPLKNGVTPVTATPVIVELTTEIP